MKNRTNLYYLFGIGILALILTGCGVAQLAIGVAQIGTSSVGGSSNSKKIHPVNAYFQPDVDTKKTICKRIGNPTYIVDVKNNKVVLAYRCGMTTYMFAIKNGLYQAKLAFSSEGIENDKGKGILVAELIKWFPCFQETVETVTRKTPTTPVSQIPISSFAPGIVPASY